MSSRKLEQLRIWHDARLFVVEIYRLLSDNRDFGFRDQIQRATVSIMNNIAEGSEYNSDAVFIRYLNIAKGSCAEVKSMLYLCEDLGYCTPETREKLHEQLLKLTSGIYKIIQYLENSQNH